MLKTVYEKWEELKKLSIDENQENISLFYLGKNSYSNMYFSILRNQLGIYIEFTKEVLARLDIPNVKGMTISIKGNEHINKNRMYIFVQNCAENDEIFQAFSSSLSDRLADANSYYDVYEIFKQVTQEYKEYFSNPNYQLSKAEEQGLCAELIELKHLIEIKGDSAVYNWQGPAKNKRDFVFEKSALEIKSTSNQEDPSIHISNENQLDASYPNNLDKLFVKAFVMEELDNGLDVLSCISDVMDSLSEIQAQKVFTANLIKLKINRNTYKPRYHFAIQKEQTYLIENGFPSITKKDIDDSIFNVSYRLKLNKLQKYEVEEGDVDGQL